MEWKPWERHPDLTQGNLEFVANLLWEIDDEVLQTHLPSEGDSNWGLGCRVYDRVRNTLPQAAEIAPWLTVEDTGSLRLVFRIGSVPIRIFSAAGPSAPARVMKHDPIEASARQLAFTEMADEFEKWFRLAVHRGAGGIEKIKLLEVDDSGRIFNEFDIPLAKTRTILTRIRKPAVEVAPVEIRSRRREQRKASSHGPDAG